MYSKFNTRIKIVLLFILSMSLLWQCSGLVRFKISEDNIQSAKDSWLTAYKSNLRRNAIDTDVLPPYQVAWSKRYKSVITDQPLAIGNYILFTLENGMLAYCDVELGHMVGDGRIAPGFLHSGTIDNNILYYGANLGREPIAALDLTTLKRQWELTLPTINTSPMSWDKYIYVGTENNQIFCLNRNSGDKVWSLAARSTLFGVPAEDGGQLYFTDVKGNIYCLDGKTGTIIWEQHLDENIYNGPVIGNKYIFVGTTSGYFYALEPDSGEIVWNFDSRGSIYGHAAYKNGIVYFGNNAHFVYALDEDNGEVIWQFKSKGINNTAPLVGLDLLYFSSWDKSFYALDRYDGKMIYRREFKSPIKSSPLIYRNKIYFQTANDHFYCLENQKNASKTGE